MAESAASRRPNDTADPVDEDLRAQIRAELQTEHEERLARFEQKRTEARSRAHSRKDERSRRAEEQLREDERRRFYQEQGYQEYVDSNGRTQWLPPDEYAWRMKRRKRRDKGREYRPDLSRRRRELVIYAVAAAVALALGLLLVS